MSDGKGFTNFGIVPARLEGAKKLSGAAAATALAMVQRGEVGFAIGPSLISYGGAALLGASLAEIVYPGGYQDGAMETLAVQAAINAAAVYALFAMSGAPDVMTALAIGGGCVLGEYAYMQVLGAPATAAYY